MASPSPDLLQTFTGISSAQVLAVLKLALDKQDTLETGLIEWLTRQPIKSLTGFLLSTSVAFYAAERNVNPKIKTFVDAVYYISTCLSVGYADIFAQTQTGKLIATLVMTLGPALTSRVLDLPERPEPVSAEILERLDAILVELQQRSV
jgi:hypothetical protein